MVRECLIAFLIATARSLGSAVQLDASRLGRRFDGVGALSGGGATSRLLIDYDDGSGAVYDLLFRPMFGASMHILKIEVGGDSFTGCGSEPSIQHTVDDLDDKVSFARGYEGNVVRAALARNPSMLGYTLSWGFPGHLGGYLSTPLTNATAAYEARFCIGAKAQWGYTCDYTGIHNEMPWSVEYVTMLRRTLDAAGLNDTKIVVSDNFGDFDAVATQIIASKEMRTATGVIGAHYPHASNSTSLAVETGTPLWSSEDSSTYFDAQGGACLARILNWNVLYGNMTSTIVWNLATAYLEQLHWYGDSLLAAAQPWSGSYYAASPLWAMAHWGQFVHPGYKFLHPGMGAGELPGGGTFVTIAEPAQIRRRVESLAGFDLGQVGTPAQERNATIKWLSSGYAYRQHDETASAGASARLDLEMPAMDWAVILETTTFGRSMCIRQNPSKPWHVDATQDVTFQLGPDLSRPSKLVVWKTVFFASQGEPVTWFQRMPDIDVTLGGAFTVHGIRQDSQYTIASRDGGQQHGKPAIPSSKPSVFPANWTESFDEVPTQTMARFFSDQAGTFAASEDIPGAKGTAYLQNVTEPPLTWHWPSNDDPVYALSIGGRFDVADSDVSVKGVVLEEASWVQTPNDPVLSLRPCAANVEGKTVPGDLAWVQDPGGVLNGSIANPASRQCLDVFACDKSVGTPAWMWPCSDDTGANCGSRNQLWTRLYPGHGDGFQLQTRMQSGLCLEAKLLPDSGIPNAYNVTMQACSKPAGHPVEPLSQSTGSEPTQLWQEVGQTGQLQAVGQTGPGGKAVCLSAVPPGSLPQASVVAVGVRLGGTAASNATNAACAAYASSWYQYGYWLFLQSNGTWILGGGTGKPADVDQIEWDQKMRERSMVSQQDTVMRCKAVSGGASEVAYGQQVVLATGSITMPGESTIGQWHELRLRVSGTELTAFIDGNQVGTATDSAYALGWVGIGSGYHRAAFDNWQATTTSLGLALQLPPAPPES